jgi:predicted SAM-dependent methyltransferase
MNKQHSRRFIIGIIGLIGASAGIAGGYGLKAAASHHQIADYLRNHAVRKLQIGAGGAGRFTEFADWLNTDIEPEAGEAYLDATKPFPIPDGALSIIFSEHVFEHLSYRDGLAMLGESYRTLKPGGKIRIATPNVLSLIQLFQNPKTDEMRNYIHDKLAADYWEESLPQTISPECVILNAELNGSSSSLGHKFVYDPQTLRESLERRGFQSIKQFAPGESDDPQLRGLELRHKSVHHAMNDYETMVFQAVRP